MEKMEGMDRKTILENLRAVCSVTDTDTLQDLFQTEMDEDGYFQDIDIASQLTREQCVELLDGAGIECREDEGVEVLREAVQANIEDGTLAYGDVEMLCQ